MVSDALITVTIKKQTRGSAHIYQHVFEFEKWDHALAFADASKKAEGVKVADIRQKIKSVVK